MPMVVSAAAATAAADGAPRGTVCTDGAATAQDPSRSFIATPAAVAFRPPGQPALRPSVRPSSQVWPDPTWTLEKQEHSAASATHVGRNISRGMKARKRNSSVGALFID